jgi:hypothetical protein
MLPPNALTNKGIPAGTVQFTVDGSRVGERVKLDAKGRAAWETSRLKVGIGGLYPYFVTSTTKGAGLIRERE